MSEDLKIEETKPKGKGKAKAAPKPGMDAPAGEHDTETLLTADGIFSPDFLEAVDEKNVIVLGKPKSGHYAVTPYSGKIILTEQNARVVVLEHRGETFAVLTPEEYDLKGSVLTPKAEDSEGYVYTQR